MKYIIAIIQPGKLDALHEALGADTKKSAEVIETIQKTAESGKIGDGKIFALDLKDALRIRTGETGAEAL